MRVLLVAGSTKTGLIDGISAAGLSPAVMGHTPAADAEILVYGEPTMAPVTPVSPTGCPTPAAVSRAVREVIGFEVTVVEAGLAEPTAAPTVELTAPTLAVDSPLEETTGGRDLREPVAVPDAPELFERARVFASQLPDDDLVLGETIPGGTTTALGVLAALGEPIDVSSSLPENPLERKRTVVETGLEASGLEAGGCADDPLQALSAMGDPVQAVLLGLTTGALEADIEVTLGGGTQLVAVAALLRHLGVDDHLRLATTTFVADDPAVDLESVADRLGLEIIVTDPGFDRGDHVAMARYCAGEAKEGVAMGGVLSLVPPDAMGQVSDRFVVVCERLGIDTETRIETDTDRR